jgi:hypothetical protein
VVKDNDEMKEFDRVNIKDEISGITSRSDELLFFIQNKQ